MALLLAACHWTQSPSGQVLYDHARQLLESEDFQKAGSEAGRGLAVAAPGSKLAWNLRLLQVEILLGGGEAKRASAELEAAAPQGPAMASSMARYRFCQGYSAQLLHEAASARLRLNEAQALAESTSDDRLLAEIELRRATLAIDTHDPDGAKAHLSRVLAYAMARNDHVLRMRGTGDVGFLLLNSGRYDEAIPWFDQTLAQARLLGARASEARVLGNLGYCFFRLGDLDKAMQHLRLAEARSREAGNRRDVQAWLGNIANIEESTGQYDAAAVDYAKALAISRELGDENWTATWLNNLAVIAIEHKDWTAAERYNNEALAHQQRVGDESDRAYGVINSGRIFRGRGQYAEAQRAFKSILRRPTDDLTPLLDAHAGLAGAYADQQLDSDAQAEFNAAIAVVSKRQAALTDEQERLTWFDSMISFYHDYVAFEMDRKQALTALEVVESSRGRVLNTRLGSSGLTVRRTARDLQKRATESESTLLVYWVGPEKSFGWTITRSGVRCFELPGRAELQQLVNDYNGFIQDLHDPLSEGSSAGEKLYRILIEPAHVTGAKVVLQPDGPLHSLSFGTLPVAGAKVPHYWIEDARVSIVPSFELPLREQARGARSLLLMGNPAFADAEYPELQFAGQEMSSIQERLPGVRQVVYAKREARPTSYARARPGDFSWIHFVAHATANQEEPLQSAVILSRDDGAGYRLFAKDVVGIPLHADLVTISACRSAGARIYAGEGLVGFSWAFLKSGARNVIAGLWDVNDRSTADMMAAMYGELGRGAAPGDALRTAQLGMVRSKSVFRKPYYWGPFEVFRATAE